MILRHRSLALVLVAWVGLSACNHSTSPAKVASGAILTPNTNLLLIGETQTFTMALTFSDGSQSNATTPTFGSDNTFVATVDTTGTVTAHNFGKATIFADAQGLCATRLISVMPNFRGTWSGFFNVDSCTQTGAFAMIDFCSILTVGPGDTLALTVTQNQTALSGTISLGGFPSPMSGSVDANGTMLINAMIPATSGTTMTVNNWAVRSDTPGTMTGTFTLTWSNPALTGSSDWSNHLVGVVRTSGGPASAAPPSSGLGAIQRGLRVLSRGGL